MPVVTDLQMVSLRTFTGKTVTEFLPSDMTGLQWNRELQQVSQCTLATPPLLDSDGNMLPLVPWLHWIDVWSTDMTPVLYWSGPIQKAATDQYAGQIAAADVASLLARQRCPISESWDGVDPSVAALAVWEVMLAQQGLPSILPVRRNDPWGQRFNITLTQDVEMLDKTMQELEQMGLKWSVNAGVPLLGPMPLEPIGALDYTDFMGKGVQVIRDGTQIFNDVLVRGPDNIVDARVPLNGLNLQTIVNVNNMFELSNVQSAAQRYVLYTGKFRTDISIPNSAVLRPDAPVTVDQLIPSARFAVSAFGVRVRQELQSMQCTLGAGQPTQVSVTLNEVPDWTEIGKLQTTGGYQSVQTTGQVGFGSGQAPSTSVVGQSVGQL